jgi:hypothetical protein
MKPAYFTLLLLFTAFSLQLKAQSDSAAQAQSFAHHDSVYAAKLNYTGNLMIGGGVGLVGVGSFLIYEGYKVYNTNVTGPNAPSTPAQNHTQGTAYFAVAGVSYAAAAVLIALGVRNKLDFKRRQKRMSLQSGLLPNGNMGAMLTF